MFMLELLATQALSSDASAAMTAGKTATLVHPVGAEGSTTQLEYPNNSGGHPPLRGTPEYPYGHPGYFNGMNMGSCPGYSGGPTDTYGTYPGAGDSAHTTHTSQLEYPNNSGGHPPLRGTPEYPYGHPGYFNGTNAGSSPGYTGGPTDTYGTYPGAGDSANTTHTSQLEYPNNSGGHPPLRGTPEYPYGHPGYFNGTHAGSSPGYTGGPTDTYGTYPGAGDSANTTHTSQLEYPNNSGGHPPLRGTPEYPYGHPGYFNGTNAGSSPGYTGGPTDTYGTYPGAGDSANTTHTAALSQWDKNEADFVWQRGYSWCSPPPAGAEGGCAVYTTQQLAVIPELSAAVVEEKKMGEGEGEKKVAASPGHLLMLGHASLFGAAEATWNMVCSGSASKWGSDFKSASCQAAEAASPVGGYVMRQHLCKA